MPGNIGHVLATGAHPRVVTSTTFAFFELTTIAAQ